MLDKNALRNEMTDRRLALDQDTVRDQSLAAQMRVMELVAWRRAREVLLYVDCRNEISTRLLLQRAWDTGKRVLLPRVCQARDDGLRGRMDLALVRSDEDIAPGSFGIMEPDPERCPTLASCSPDLAVVPGVVFDRQGYRLGYGGGYYDRFIAGAGGVTTRADLAPTLLVGMAYTFQIVETLPVDPWDMPVAAIATETGIVWPRT